MVMAVPLAAPARQQFMAVVAVVLADTLATEARGAQQVPPAYLRPQGMTAEAEAGARTVAQVGLERLVVGWVCLGREPTVSLARKGLGQTGRLGEQVRVGLGVSTAAAPLGHLAAI